MTLSPVEFGLMRTFIERHCGIHLEDGKEYLVETRLTDLVRETGSASFLEFHDRASRDSTGRLRNRIVDAMTTNETYWFRDDTLWRWLGDRGVPDLVRRAGTSTAPVRVWSAAASTGQEAYSLLMLIAETAFRLGIPSAAERIEVVGTDISSAALFLASAGRWDKLAIRRGLSEERRLRFFREDDGVWEIDARLRARVKFRRFNLMDPLSPLGTFDMVLCRYVAIYFAEEFKRDLFRRIARAMRPDSVLVIGATESLRGLSDFFDNRFENGCTTYVCKPGVA